MMPIFAGIDLPLLGPGADGADGPLGVLERRRMAVAASAVAVFEDEAGDAQRVAPLGDLLALVIHGQAAVSAAGADDDRRAVGLVRLGQPDGQRRLVGRRVALGPRRAVGPEQFDLPVRQKWLGQHGQKDHGRKNAGHVVDVFRSAHDASPVNPG